MAKWLPIALQIAIVILDNAVETAIAAWASIRGREFTPVS